jgi:hypothetical protein
MRRRLLPALCAFDRAAEFGLLGDRPCQLRLYLHAPAPLGQPLSEEAPTN